MALFKSKKSLIHNELPAASYEVLIGSNLNASRGGELNPCAPPAYLSASGGLIMVRDIPYNDHFGVKKGNIGPENTYFWGVNL